MRALVFREFQGPLSVQTLPDPAPPPDGVVVRVQHTGICRSDWHAWQGHDTSIRLPHVSGHEFAGEIVAVGKSVRALRLGDRVTVPFVSGCGVCSPCRAQEPQVCDAQFQPGFTHFGSFAELVVLHYADLNVVRLPEDMDSARAASLGCRFVTAYRALVELAHLVAGETLAIFGAGGVGLSALLIARALGARTLVVDIDASKLELASSLGADLVVHSTPGHDPVAELVDATNGGAHVSLDALGSGVTLRQSLLSLGKRGRHVQVGLLVGEGSSAELPVDRIVAYELALFGSHGIAARSYPEVFRLIREHSIPLERLTLGTVPLSGIPAVLASMTEFGGLGITLADPASAGS